MFWLAKLATIANDMTDNIPAMGKQPFCEVQITDMDSLRETIIAAFRLYKEMRHATNLQMLMGMELVSLKGFNEFMTDYEKLVYCSGHADDEAIKQNLITRIPHPIPEKVYDMMKNKGNIEEHTLADVGELIRICIKDLCMDRNSIKQVIKNRVDPKDCQLFL
jgi:hypothetical protein